MTPSYPWLRGDPDLFTPAAPPACGPASRRYRLLLTRLPGRWELIVFDRECTGVMRRFEGPVVAALRETTLPPELLADGACDADKRLVQHLFLAAAALTAGLERCRRMEGGQPDPTGDDPPGTQIRLPIRRAAPAPGKTGRGAGARSGGAPQTPR